MPTARAPRDAPVIHLRSLSNLCSDSVLTGQREQSSSPRRAQAYAYDWSPFVTTSNRIYLQCGSAFVVGDKVKLTEEDGGNLDGGITDGKEETVSAVKHWSVGDENAAGDDMEGVPPLFLTASRLPVRRCDHYWCSNHRRDGHHHCRLWWY